MYGAVQIILYQNTFIPYKKASLSPVQETPL